ncbi:hypothetical protein NUACC21_33820 [Scytonema sp. NUACC21]
MALSDGLIKNYFCNSGYKINKSFEKRMFYNFTFMKLSGQKIKRTGLRNVNLPKSLPMRNDKELGTTLMS